MVIGIPQGKIFGPVLFILFINNVSDGLLLSKIQLYVDDSKIYGDATSMEKRQAFERDILVVNDWFQSWQLKIIL